MAAIISKEQVLAGNAKLAAVKKRVDDLNKGVEDLSKFLSVGGDTEQKMKTVRRGLLERFRELKVDIPVLGLIFMKKTDGTKGTIGENKEKKMATEMETVPCLHQMPNLNQDRLLPARRQLK